MAKFNLKKSGESLKSAGKYIKENPTLPLAAASLGVAGANYKINTKRQKEAKELSNKQLEMMQKQMDVLKDNTKALHDSIKSQHEISSAYRDDLEFRKAQGTLMKLPKEEQKKRPRFFKKLFSEEQKPEKRKLFSIKSSTIAGAQLGASIGTLGASSNKIVKAIGPKPIFNKLGDGKKATLEQRMGLVVAGTILGAALGALVGTIGEISNKVSRRSVNSDRLMPKIISNLKKDNLKEGYDYTRDPKIADKLKTRVCLAISRNSGDLRVLINTKSEPKLKNLTDNIVKNIPNAGVENKTASNKFNEITISTISDNSADATLVSSIAEQFIHSGYPVYLVEVG